MANIEQYFKDLQAAEFENDADPKQMVRLLKRAASWKTLANLQKVCTYLGAECDDRIETVDGCRAIIQEDIDYWRGEW